MYLLINEPKLLHKLVDKQFEMIGRPDIKFNDLEKNIMVTVKEGSKEKKLEWWKVYKFEDETQYEEWKMWASKEMQKYPDIQTDRQLLENLNFLDLVYGLIYKIKRQ